MMIKKPVPIENSQKFGIIFAIIANSWFGFAGYYWHFLNRINPLNIMLVRAFTALIYTAIVLFILKIIFKKEKLLSKRINMKEIVYYIIAAFFLCINGVCYIILVNTGNVFYAGIAYFISPIIIMVFDYINGILNRRKNILKAKHLIIGVSSFTIVISGVLLLLFDEENINFNVFLSILTAFGFSCYGFVTSKIKEIHDKGEKTEKKIMNLSISLNSFLFSQFFLLLFAILFNTLLADMLKNCLNLDGFSSILLFKFNNLAPHECWLLLFSGLITLVPNVLYVLGRLLLINRTKDLLWISGILQFLDPIIATLFVACFLLKEDVAFKLGYLLILISVILYIIFNNITTIKEECKNGQT